MAMAPLVLIVDHEREVYLPATDLQEVYDLTSAEAQVAIWALRGHGLQYVADELRVSLSTVRASAARVRKDGDTPASGARPAAHRTRSKQCAGQPGGTVEE